MKGIIVVPDNTIVSAQSNEPHLSESLIPTTAMSVESIGDRIR